MLASILQCMDSDNRSSTMYSSQNTACKGHAALYKMENLGIGVGISSMVTRIIGSVRCVGMQWIVSCYLMLDVAQATIWWQWHGLEMRYGGSSGLMVP